MAGCAIAIGPRIKEPAIRPRFRGYAERMNAPDKLAHEALARASQFGSSRTVLADGRGVFIKRRADAPPCFFAAEAHGLALLRESRCLRVPQVWAVDARGIVLEDLGTGRPDPAQWQDAGALLARQHGQHGQYFGLDRDGWCGDSRQSNTPDTDGWRFFAEQRLLPQARRARDAKLLQSDDIAAIEQLCRQLPQRIPEQPASLLHGDLWRANLHACGDGELALIDAGAVHHGWAEADLAMLTLFGQPPHAFFDAYQDESGCAPDWRQRAPIYNLYHLLNHLNLFGLGYLSGVRDALRISTSAP